MYSFFMIAKITTFPVTSKLLCVKIYLRALGALCVGYRKSAVPFGTAPFEYCSLVALRREIFQIYSNHTNLVFILYLFNLVRFV